MDHSISYLLCILLIPVQGYRRKSNSFYASKWIYCFLKCTLDIKTDFISVSRVFGVPSKSKNTVFQPKIHTHPQTSRKCQHFEN